MGVFCVPFCHLQIPHHEMETANLHEGHRGGKRGKKDQPNFLFRVRCRNLRNTESTLRQNGTQNKPIVFTQSQKSCVFAHGTGVLEMHIPARPAESEIESTCPSTFNFPANSAHALYYIHECSIWCIQSSLQHGCVHLWMYAYLLLVSRHFCMLLLAQEGIHTPV